MMYGAARHGGHRWPVPLLDLHVGEHATLEQRDLRSSLRGLLWGGAATPLVQRRRAAYVAGRCVCGIHPGSDQGLASEISWPSKKEFKLPPTLVFSAPPEFW